MAALLLSLGAVPMEHVYSVAGRMVLPQHGEVTSKLTLRLSEVTEPEIAGQGQLFRLDVDEGSQEQRAPKHGASARDVQELHRLPVYFRQSTNGIISDVWHDPKETFSAIGTKKALVASLQLVVHETLRPSSSGRAAAATTSLPNEGEWYAPEVDVVGAATAKYSVARHAADADDTDAADDDKGGGGGRQLQRQRRALVQKRLHDFVPPAVPRGFTYEVNTTAVLDLGDGQQGDREGGPRPILPTHLHMTALFRPDHAAFDAGAAANGNTGVQFDGFDLLPTQPSEMVWSLVGSSAIPAARRKLHAGPMASGRLVRSPLHHQPPLPSVHELRRHGQITDHDDDDDDDDDDEMDDDDDDDEMAAGDREERGKPCYDAASLACLASPERPPRDRMACLRQLETHFGLQTSRCQHTLLAALGASLRSDKCAGEQASLCAPVANALVLFSAEASADLDGSDGPAARLTAHAESVPIAAACEVLAAWIGNPRNTPHLPIEAYAAIHTFPGPPCATLLETLAALLAPAPPVSPSQSMRGTGGPNGPNGPNGPTGPPPPPLPLAIRERLLLAAAAAASASRRSYDDVAGAQHPSPVSPANGAQQDGAPTEGEAATSSDDEARRAARAVRAIAEKVRLALREATASSERWDALHARVTAKADAHWHEKLTPHEREVCSPAGFGPSRPHFPHPHPR